jgi:hypothetical protein
LALACDINKATALVNEGIREKADKVRFKRGDGVFLGRHVDDGGSCPLWRGTFLSNARTSQENES